MAAAITVPGVASADPLAPNPYASATAVKIYDGTGFGSGAAPWVNTANGFFPGDDDAHDGVVSSGDSVGYDLTVQVAAGPARTVHVLFGIPAYLHFEPARNASLCAVNQFVTGAPITVGGDPGCAYQIRAGVPVTITTPLTLTAADTAGTAQYGQAVTVSTGLAGEAPYARFSSSSVAVVSAPAADVVVKPSQCTVAGACSTQDSGTVTGHFDLLVQALRYVGFDSTKGASTATAWWGTLDVSAFPAGTSWQLGVTPVAPVGGIIDIPPTIGDLRASYTAPEHWGLEVATNGFFPVQLTVHPDAFATPDFRNNGTGWQPGDNAPSSQSTLDANGTGARAGYLYPNNDWSAARIARKPPAEPGQVFDKQLQRPWSAGQGLFQDGNMLFSEGSSALAPQNANLRQNQVAPGTEVDAELSADTAGISGTPAQVVLSDQWDPAEQAARGPVTVLAPDGTDVTSRALVQWFTGAAAPGAAAVDTSITTGWVTQAAPPVNARAVRVILANLPVGDDEGAGRFTAVVPLQVLATLAEPIPAALWDTFYGQFTGSDPTEAPRFVTPVLESPPVLTVGMSITSIPDTELDRSTNRVDYRVIPSVTNVSHSDQPIVGTMTLELDACVTDFALTTGAWELVGVPSYGTGCGTGSHTPGTVTLQPAGGSWLPSNLNNGTTVLPLVLYSTTVSRLAVDQVIASATWELDRDDVAAVTAGTQLAAPLLVTVGNMLSTSTPLVEITDPLRFQAVIHLTESAVAPASETVIVMPGRGNDAAYLTQLTSSGFYPPEAPTESDFHGSYEVTGVSVDAADSVPGTQVWCTTDASPSLDPADSTWVLCADLTGVTAIKVTQTGGGTVGISTVDIELTPADNRPGDNYLMWIGPTHYGDADDATEMAWPVNDVVVASYVSGVVYWDQSGIGTDYQPGWEGIPGVTVELLDAADTVLSTTTLASGHYAFPDVVLDEHPLHSGDYQVRISGYPLSLPSAHYTGKTILVDQTFSYDVKRLGNSADVSDTVLLPADAERRNINFGFYAADPYSDLIKSVSQVQCPEPASSNVCEIEWDVTIKNAGNTMLTSGVLTDATSNAVYDVEAFAGERVSQIAAGGLNAYAVTTSGDLYAWGSNDWGAVGDGGGADQPVPVMILPEVAEVISAGPTGYAITTSGDLYEWGQNLAGEDPGPVTATPAQILSDVVSLQLIDDDTALAITADGTLYTWGSNASGRAGQGSADPVTPTPTAVLSNVASVSFDDSTVFAITADGLLYAWGDNTQGTTGIGLSAGIQDAPQLVPGLSQVQSVTIGPATVAALTVNDDLWLWGANGNGQIGNGSQVDQLTPWQSAVTGVISIELRHDSPLAVTSTGELWSWGRNVGGVAGTGVWPGLAGIPPIFPAEGTPVLAPVRILDSVHVVSAVTPGAAASSYALTDDGRLFSWGMNSAGQLGRAGQAAHNATPTEVLPGAGIGQILVSRNSVYAITTGGDLYTWGFNSGVTRQLGRDTGFSIFDPIPALVLSDVLDLSFGQDPNLYLSVHAFTGSGSLYGWGGNHIYPFPDRARPLVGSGSLTVQTDPAPIAANIELIEHTDYNRYLLTNAGTVLAWGPNLSGQVGDGSILVDPATAVLSPVPVISPWADTETALPALSQAVAGDVTERRYGIPNLAPGESFTVTLRGLVNQGADGFTIGNQAWYTAAEDPRTAPPPGPALPPFDPDEPFEAGKWPGNADCTAGTEAAVQWAADRDGDSCDQVFASVPGTALPLGALEGIVWWDENDDGVLDPTETRLGGFTATLFVQEPGEDPVQVGSRLTDGDGEYEFLNLQPRDDYFVLFSPPGMTPLEWWSYTVQAGACPTLNESCAYPVDGAGHVAGQTPVVSVFANELTTPVNAGVILNEIVPADVLLEKQGPDAAGDWQPLDGSEWALHHAVDDGAGGYTTGALAQVPDAVTGQTGLFHLTGILPGVYHLIETVAPAGYELLGQPVLVTVSNVEDPITGEISAVITVDPPAELSTGVIDQQTLDKIVVKDTPKLWVPNVGAGSWAWLIGLALGLLVLGAGGIVVIRRAGRRPEEVVA